MGEARVAPSKVRSTCWPDHLHAFRCSALPSGNHCSCRRDWIASRDFLIRYQRTSIPLSLRLHGPKIQPQPPSAELPRQTMCTLSATPRAKFPRFSSSTCTWEVLPMTTGPRGIWLRIGGGGPRTSRAQCAAESPRQVQASTVSETSASRRREGYHTTVLAGPRTPNLSGASNQLSECLFGSPTERFAS
ncbi:hypothetical protein B0T14DRAFT_28786 [Immersiella caudata]|uniref:Uncharacterized protein n=1 Tax=Immersiella caudata TaxID=314043 RepID=A0AA39XEQ9_9PEZI|nr:hypothetical protein B0T14DRAFT_28786 [Immersiella caudata]